MRQGLILAFAIFSMFFVGCGTSKSALDNESKGNEQIPADFNPANGILLIEQSTADKSDPASVKAAVASGGDLYTIAYMTKNKKNMVEYAQKNYMHKHQFAYQNEIYTDSLYNDKTLYRYALVTSVVKPIQHDKFNARTGQVSPTNYQPVFRFYLYDRLNDKTYSSLGNGSSLIMWAYKAAIKKLNGKI